MASQMLNIFYVLVCLSCICVDSISMTFTQSSNQTVTRSVFLRALNSTTLGQLLEGTSGHIVIHGNSCLAVQNDEVAFESCLSNQCISGEEVAQLYGLSPDKVLSENILAEVAPAVLYTMNQRSSCISSPENATSHLRPSPSAVWGYSFLFVTLINLCSLTGILVLPCMKTSIYKLILMFMVALAVGTLVGSSALVLIPEAFELVAVGESPSETEGEDANKHVWTATSIIGGIFLFFLIERIMRMINVWRQNTKDKKQQDEIATRGTLTSSFTPRAPRSAGLDMKDPSTVNIEASPSSDCLTMCAVQDGQQEDASPLSSENAAVSINGADLDDKLGDVTKGALIPKMVSNGHSHHGHFHGEQVAPVAYMVIFGDGLHNFIDGLSIGTAFTESILLGISVSVAVLCEELPHELGDFAILLNAGMRLRKALMYNFLSSLMCYLGLIIGILVGEHTTAHTWIFGVAGGMFLYISLVDMMPEMNNAAESEEGKQFGMWRTFVLQVFGLMTGYTIMLLMALYGGEISFE